MLKRFYSKKSGFTLVEIVIALAVFAIMASMICQIMDLAVNAKLKNTQYANELIAQEKRLTLIEKKSDDFTEAKGEMIFQLNGEDISLPYDKVFAAPDPELGGGLGYFLSPVDYQSDGEFTPSTGDTGSTAGNNSGSQASRMDTRITGTGGISDIQIVYVIKDTHTYAAGDPYAVPAGHSRYFIMCCASAGSLPQTLKAEDIPYSQYRLHFYHEHDPANPDDNASALNAAASSVEYTDADGRVYTKEVYKEARIINVGYIRDFSAATSNGLQSSNIENADKVSKGESTTNRYTVEKKGTNVVRIGSPFIKNNNVDGGLGNKGVKFSPGNMTKFYVEFEGDPHITAASFGHNAKAGTGLTSGWTEYTACPSYTEEYDSDGNPLYYSEDDNHVNIYGAFLYKRNYK